MIFRGNSCNSSDGFDGLDAPWLGPGFATEYGVLYFVAPDGSQLVHDIRNPDWVEKVWHFIVQDENVNGDWVLRWPNLSSIPGNIQLSLESPEGTVIIPDLRDSLSYHFSLSSGNEQDFYLRALVEADSIPAAADIGFVQNPGVTRNLDLYLFPDEPLDDLFLFVEGQPITMGHVDELYNVYRGALEMGSGGEKQVIMHMIDLETNVSVDTITYDFVLSGTGGGPLLVQAPNDEAEFSIPGNLLPDGTWVGLGVHNSGTPEGAIYSIQPYGLVFPEGSELILYVDDEQVDLHSVQVCRMTALGWEPMSAQYDAIGRIIRVAVRRSGNYALRRSTGDDASTILPNSTTLMNNYPNPFNAVTMIPYTLMEPGLVTMKVYDLLGREVITLVNEYQEAGLFRQQWDGHDRFGRVVSSGVYLVRFRAGDYAKTKKVMMLK